jgi:adenylate cyclase
MRRRILIGLGIGASAAALAWLAGRLPLVQRLEAVTYDARVRYAAPLPDPQSPVVLVEIDETSLRTLEPAFGRWPWPRAVHAGVIDFLARAQARLIVYDVLFSERDIAPQVAVGGRMMSGAESDAALVASVRAAGNVVLAADASYAVSQSSLAPEGLPALPGVTYDPGPGFVRRPDLRPPFDELRAAARAIGHTYLVHESSEPVRGLRPFVLSGNVAIPSLGLAAVLAAENLPRDAVRLEGHDLRIGSRRMPLLAHPELTPYGTLTPSRQVVLNFSRPDNGSSFPRQSFFTVLLSEDKLSIGEPPLIPPSFFKDKVVFIGTSAAGLKDVYTMPFQADAAPGILLHATLADNVLSGRFMRRASDRTGLAIALGVGLIAGAMSTTLPVAWATTAVFVVLTALIAWFTRAIGHGLWLGAVVPVSTAALALFGGVAWQYFVEGREKREIRQLFGRYVSKDVIGQLMSNPSLARLGGERRDMTVLFSDIRGFTTATEKGTPEAVVAQLNEYFGVMVDVLFRHHGTLDKFVGDMVMGLFGAPLDDPLHADHAVAAAREMSVELDRLNEKWKAEGSPSVDIGIGINSGEMIAGNIGSTAIMSYTVIGDAVNLGSRLESLNKEHGTRILISQATRDRLTMPVETRLVGEAHVKGRAQAVVVYEVKP